MLNWSLGRQYDRIVIVFGDGGLIHVVVVCGCEVGGYKCGQESRALQATERHKSRCHQKSCETATTFFKLRISQLNNYIFHAMTLRKPCSILAATGHGFILSPPFIRASIPLHRTSFLTARHLLSQHHRLGSTTQYVATKSRDVNPSKSTLPAPLDVPSREEGQGLPSYLLKCGKAYLGFYKTGIKNIWHNYKDAKAIRHKLRSTQTPKLPPSPSSKKHNNSYTKFVLTRAEYQFLRRSEHDMRRVPIFGLLFLLMGEYLPLVVIFFTPLVPYTCRIPKQIQRAREKLEKRREDSFRAVTDSYVPSARGKEGEVRQLDDLEKGQLMHISRSLGLHGAFWDRTKGALPQEAILRFKVGKWLQYLEKDDALVQRDGSMKELRGEELKLAAEQRGIDVMKRKEDELKSMLERWIKGRSEGKVLPMLLTR
jgi:hypothetical protein